MSTHDKIVTNLFRGKIMGSEIRLKEHEFRNLSEAEVLEASHDCIAVILNVLKQAQRIYGPFQPIEQYCYDRNGCKCIAPVSSVFHGTDQFGSEYSTRIKYCTKLGTSVFSIVGENMVSPGSCNMSAILSKNPEDINQINEFKFELRNMIGDVFFANQATIDSEGKIKDAACQRLINPLKQNREDILPLASYQPKNIRDINHDKVQGFIGENPLLNFEL